MKTRAIILAGGEGSRLGVLTAKRTKPAVPFAGKYRIIDFTLSNCVNSNLFDVLILAQYRPHSLIEHIGAGGPWDLNRDFTGGVRIYSPYKARRPTDWYLGTADSVQQNFSFIKSTNPDFVLILSGDHIYEMNYDAMIAFHIDHRADVTLGTITVPIEDASRFGIVGVNDKYRVTSFIEKPSDPQSNLVNMGVYLFSMDVLDRVLWQDYKTKESAHDFGKNILPGLVAEGARVHAFPFSGYWVDVGTTASYWQAHMDLLSDPPSLDLNDRSWIIHTRTEERPPARIARGAQIHDSMITDGCVVAPDAIIERSVLGPGVRIASGAIVRESVILTDCEIHAGASVERAILDKRVQVGEKARVGSISSKTPPQLVMAGKNSHIPPGFTIEPGAVIPADIRESDYPSKIIKSNTKIDRGRDIPHEI
ncbi:MAG: NTP transferase domain-containing protein [Chloroflexi bacterium]|nr:NTP transferase domain-containing protein [Chloroflexota bacterium]